MRPSVPTRVAPILAAALLLAAAPAAGESDLRLGVPSTYGAIPATTHDEAGDVLGESHVVMERLDGGLVRLVAQAGIDGGARTVMTARLAPVDGGTALTPLVQESRTFLGDGTPMGVLRVDHRSNVASCTTPEREGGATLEREIPDEDRVANVALSLLFLPLARGETDSVPFTLFLCRDGPRFVDFEAHVERRGLGGNGRPGSIVEVVYTPDLGRVLSVLARGMVPRLSIWFDPKAPNPWVGHRIPLYGQGPEVLVVRDGISPLVLTNGELEH